MYPNGLCRELQDFRELVLRLVALVFQNDNAMPMRHSSKDCRCTPISLTEVINPPARCVGAVYTTSAEHHGRRLWYPCHSQILGRASFHAILALDERHHIRPLSSSDMFCKFHRDSFKTTSPCG